MSFLLRDQWQTWAQEWSLTHVPERGWLRRTERVLGERKGFLVRVLWGPDEDPGLHVCVRFPRAADLQQLRTSLTADTGLDTLPGKGSARTRLEVQAGPPPRVRLGRRPELLLEPCSLLWRRTFAFRVPRPAEIMAWVDTLVAAVGRATPAFQGKCETCTTGLVARYVVVDGQPMLLCGTCQQRLRLDGEMAERSYEMLEARHLNGFALASAAAVAGGAVWALVAALTQHIFSVAAIGIGGLVAFAYRRGAVRVDIPGRVIAAALTLASVVLGQVGLYAYWVSVRFPEVGFRLDAGWLAYVATWERNPGEEFMPLLFGLVGAWFASQALQKPKLAAKIEDASATSEPPMRKAA